MTGQEPAPATTPIGLAEGCRRLDISMLSLWIGYFAVGGNGSVSEVRRWLTGVLAVPPQDHEFLAQALNDRFTESGLDHPVTYSRD